MTQIFDGSCRLWIVNSGWLWILDWDCGIMDCGWLNENIFRHTHPSVLDVHTVDKSQNVDVVDGCWIREYNMWIVKDCWLRKYSGTHTPPPSAPGGWPARQLWAVASGLAWVGLSCFILTFVQNCLIIVLLALLRRIKIDWYRIYIVHPGQIGGHPGHHCQWHWSSERVKGRQVSQSVIMISSDLYIFLHKYGHSDNNWHRSLAGTYPFNLNNGQQVSTKVCLFPDWVALSLFCPC